MAADADVPPGFTPFHRITTHSTQSFKWLTSSRDSGPSSSPPPASSATGSESAGREASCQKKGVSIDADHQRQERERRPTSCYYYARQASGKRAPFFDPTHSARPGSSEEQLVLALGVLQETDSRNGVQVSGKLTGTSAAAGPSSLPPPVSSTTGSESVCREAVSSLLKGTCMQASHNQKGEGPTSCYYPRRASRKRVRPQVFDPHPPNPKKQQLVLALAVHQETDSRNGVRVSVASLKMPQKHINSSTQTDGDQYWPVTESRMGQMEQEAVDASFGSGQASFIERSIYPSQDLDRTIISPSRHVLSGTDYPHYECQRGKTLEPWCSSIDSGFLQHVADAFKDSSGNLVKGIQSTKGQCIMKPTLQPTLLGILKMYGDITKDCPLESGNYILTSVLEGICNVVQELQQKKLTELNFSLLNRYYSAVRDAEVIKLDVKWLQDQLDEIKDAVKLILETKRILDEKHKCMRRVEKYKMDLQSMNVELETLNSKIKDKEKMLALDAVIAEVLNQKINALIPRFKHFQSMPLMKTF